MMCQRCPAFHSRHQGYVRSRTTARPGAQRTNNATPTRAKSPTMWSAPLVADAHPVFKARTVQGLVQPAFHAPILPVDLHKRLGVELVGRPAGHQILGFLLGVLAELPMQAPQLRRPGQTQLRRLKVAHGQGAPLIPTPVVVLDPHHPRGERSPAGVVERFQTGRPLRPDARHCV